jgi:hypothetical protein
VTEQPDDLTRQLAIPDPALTAVAIDFDGVVHQYRRGWHDGTCYDGPMPGAIDALDDFRTRRPVAIVTARPIAMVADWFDVHAPHIPLYVDINLHREWWGELGTLLLTNRKIVAQHYIDDRALRFTAETDGWPGMLNRVAVWDRNHRLMRAQLAQEAASCD